MEGAHAQAGQNECGHFMRVKLTLEMNESRGGIEGQKNVRSTHCLFKVEQVCESRPRISRGHQCSFRRDRWLVWLAGFILRLSNVGTMVILRNPNEILQSFVIHYYAFPIHVILPCGRI